MTYLVGKDYVAPEATKKEISSQKKTAINGKIKELCPKDGKKSYEEIVKHIQAEYVAIDEHYTSGEIVAMIKDLKDKDKDYELPEVEATPEVIE